MYSGSAGAWKLAAVTAGGGTCGRGGGTAGTMWLGADVAGSAPAACELMRACIGSVDTKGGIDGLLRLEGKAALPNPPHNACGGGGGRARIWGGSSI